MKMSPAVGDNLPVWNWAKDHNNYISDGFDKNTVQFSRACGGFWPIHETNSHIVARDAEIVTMGRAEREAKK